MATNLPHTRNSKAGANNYEVVNPSQFEAYIIPPAGVNGSAAIMTEHVMDCQGLFTEPTEGKIQQKFKTASRNYDTNDGETSIEFTITFSLNLNESHQNYIYNMLRDWKRLQRNPLTGERGLKRDYIGTVKVVKHDRDGTIFWTRTAHQVFITSNLPDLENNYGSSEPSQVQVTFSADWFDEEGL